MANTTLLLLLIVTLAVTVTSVLSLRVVCYYDSTSYWREGTAKFLPQDVEPSLSYCTHIIYRHAKINDAYKVESLDNFLDLDPGKGNYHALTNLKKRFPGLHVLLQVGGSSDSAEIERHMTMLEDANNRKEFIDSARTLARQYGFDGIDLALRFPELYKKNKDRGTFGQIWHSIKKTFGYAHGHTDEKEEEHRQGFTSLVKDLKSLIKHDGLLLTISASPVVNPASYFEVKSIESNLDAVNLIADDYKTPKRNPDQADYPAPLYASGQRTKNETVDGTVSWWLEQGIQGSKINVGIPTFGRTWKLTKDSGLTGVPPLTADGPGAEGPQTKIPGLLSYPEICSQIQTNQPKGTPHLLRHVTDPSHKSGTYAYRLPEEDADNGLWVGYEDPDTVAIKANYAKNKGLGGVAISDLSLDDFRGVCNGDKFPLIKAARNNL